MNQKNSNIKSINCFSRGALVPDIKGPVHRYMDASAGCWNTFGEVLNLEYSNPEYFKSHKIITDSYAVQHYGKSSSLQAVRSVNHHLTRLYFIYERKFDIKFTDAALKILAAYKKEFVWLVPPNNVGSITVVDILAATSREEYSDLVYSWGRSVWDAWNVHHDHIKSFIEKHKDEIF